MISTLHYAAGRSRGSGTTALLNDDDTHFVEEGFRNGLSVHSGIERHLRGVVRDALSHPGSLARAQIAYSLLTEFGFDVKTARDIGVAIEYFHTASLLFDDLPCMDNATKRRGHACPHTVHGESAAILGALSLITQAYGLLWSSLNQLPAENRIASTNLVNECLGINGILNGQSCDLHFTESGKRREDVLHVARGKTVTMIRLTLMLPSLMFGVNRENRMLLEELSVSWGLAYQIMDDFKDGLMKSSETGKSTARDRHLQHPNLPAVMGNRDAFHELNRQLEQSRIVLQKLHAGLPGISVLDRLQGMLESEQQRIANRVHEAEGPHVL
jgi:geranylgeranyl pyrophosphate synthase